jgi:coenzyme Q-binding protein COQ10
MPTHAEKRVLPYTPEQLFALVADVERYPEFLPWCLAARIKERRPDLMVADMIIGFRMFRERFTSRVALDPPSRIDVTYAEGPFRRLRNHWVFERVPGGCRIDFYVDFEFRSRLLQRMIEALFNEAVRRMVGAFEKRARDLYGAVDQASALAPARARTRSSSLANSAARPENTTRPSSST